MVNNYTNADRYVEFNMGVASMQRIDSIIRKITEYKTIQYSNGVPLDELIYRLLEALYTEVYPYLEKEKLDKKLMMN